MQMQFSQERIRAACKSGVEILTHKELVCPGLAPMAVGGDLTVLVQMLTAISIGELQVANVPPPEPEGEQKEDPPKLEGIEGGKKE